MNRISVCVLLIVLFMVSPAISDEMNLATCLLGSYSDICNHDLLTDEQAKKVEQVELQAKYKKNLEVCSRQLYSHECESGLLKNEDYENIQNKYSSMSRSNQNISKGELSRAAAINQANGTTIKYMDYAIDFGKSGIVFGQQGVGLADPTRTLDGRDKTQVKAQREIERDFDKAIRNVRGSGVNSARIRAELSAAKYKATSSGDRRRDRGFDKAIRNVRGMGADAERNRANLMAAKYGIEYKDFTYNKKSPADDALPIISDKGNVYHPISEDGSLYISTDGEVVEPVGGEIVEEDW